MLAIFVIGIDSELARKFVIDALDQGCEIHTPLVKDDAWLTQSTNDDIRMNPLFNVHYVSREFVFNEIASEFLKNICDGKSHVYIYTFDGRALERIEVFFGKSEEKLSLFIDGMYIVLSKRGCDFCVKAKALLGEQKHAHAVEMCDAVIFEERDVFVAVLNEYISPREQKTFPFIFDDKGDFVGGFTELSVSLKK